MQNNNLFIEIVFWNMICFGVFSHMLDTLLRIVKKHSYVIHDISTILLSNNWYKIFDIKILSSVVLIKCRNHFIFKISVIYRLVSISVNKSVGNIFLKWNCHLRLCQIRTATCLVFDVSSCFLGATFLVERSPLSTFAIACSIFRIDCFLLAFKIK